LSEEFVLLVHDGLLFCGGDEPAFFVEVFEDLDGFGGWGGFFGGHVRGEVMKSGGGKGGEIEFSVQR
jgi:hypothetical protein